MQLSYNLIRKNQVLSSNSKVISTEYVKDFDIEDDKKDIVCKQSGKTIEEIEDILSNYESIGNSIVLEAKRKKDEIMYKAMEESQAMEREAYEKGYAQGKENGYEESKKADIIRLSIAIAEKVIRKKVTDEDGISEILEEGIRLSKGEENLVIKCNPKYVSSIKEHIPVWKASYSISGEIFVLPNEGVSLGNAIIEKASGKVEVGIDVSLKAIEEALSS